MSTKIKALKLAQSAIGSNGLEKLETLVRIRELVIADDSLRDTSERNTHPAFKALLECLTEVTDPTIDDMDKNDEGKYAGVMSASNLVGIVSSLGRILEDLKSSKAKEIDIINNFDVKCIIGQCRFLAGV